MKKFLQRWRKAGDVRLELDFILSNAQPQASIEDRLNWFLELLQWVRSPGMVSESAEMKTGHIQASRLRYFLHVLSRNESWKLGVARTLRSIIRDTQAWELFSSTGLPLTGGLFSEAKERLAKWVLPQAPRDQDLGEIFEKIFATESDLQWLRLLDDKTLAEIFELFQYRDDPQEGAWNSLSQDIEDAFLYLTAQIKSYALSPSLRRRMGPLGPTRELPYFQLTPAFQNLIRAKALHDDAQVQKISGDLANILKASEQGVFGIRSHLNEYGVSVGIVFQIDRILLQIERLRDLLVLYASAAASRKEVIDFIAKLAREHHDQKSLKSLFSGNLSLLSKKIVERSAETGEHYVVRDLRGYGKMIRSAFGGGVLTSITALLRIFIETLPLAIFGRGLLSSLNYSLSFVGIQAAHFTLATKQPAMTASHLASKMLSLKTEISQQNLVREMAQIIRSQVAAIFGNLLGVIPAAFLLFLLFSKVMHHELFTLDEAYANLEDHSIFSLSLFYAGFTGILLWFSSVCAGWIDNWFAYRQIPQAIAKNRRLRFFLGGADRAEALSKWMHRSLAPTAASISLGFLLGLVPKFGKFLGLPLEVRHVTLATGTLTFAVGELGPTIFKTALFWKAVVGVLCIGFMNLFVSFLMAFLVAANAQKVSTADRAALYSAMWKSFSRNPFFYFLPLRKHRQD